MKIVNFAKRFLMRDIYEMSGFKYQFVEIESNKDFLDSLNYIINVILPDPKQSYIAEIFFQDIEEIISGFYNFLGKRYSHSLEINVINSPHPFDNVYIRPEILNEILDTINRRFNRVGFEIKNNNVSFDCFFKPNGSIDFYQENGETIEFRFSIDVSEIEINQKPVKIREGKESDFVQTIVETMYDRSWFYSEIEDVIYELLNPETDILNYEVFVAVLFNIDSVDGVKIKNYTNKEFYISDFTPKDN